MSTYDVDVIVAGAGPTGMSAALALYDLGYSVKIIDKHVHGLEFSRAVLINRSTLHALQSYGVTDKIRAQGWPLRAAIAHDVSGILFESTWAGEVNDAAILLPQLDTERCFQASLAERGVEIERPCALLGLTQDEHGVTATVSGTDAVQARTIRSRYLIGADGFHSVARQALGIDYPTTRLEGTMLSMDVRMTWPYAADVAVWLMDDGLFGALRMSNHVARLIGTSTTVEAALMQQFKIDEILWRTDFEVYFACAAEYGRGRVWLAGDAIHVHSPAGGRGMNMGIADGLALAHAIHTGDFEAYVREREPIARAWVKNNERLTRFVMSSGISGRWRRRVMRAAIKAAERLTQGGLSHRLIDVIAN